MLLNTYNRSSGFCVDPIEKKPLNHFLPGSPVLSFGTAGCNLACKFCQNWDISKSREMKSLSQFASADIIADAAQKYHCDSVAYTYNDPVIFLEYALEVAAACHERNIRSVAVTAAYINSPAREDFFQRMDAVNADLKSFDEDFYFKVTGGHLQPVLDSLQYIYHETSAWLELTTLLIPGMNDSQQELEKLSAWVMENLGPEVPIHFTAFHPDWKMQDVPATPTSRLVAAYDIAKSAGLMHVYVGNVHNKKHSSTYCGKCHKLLIGRDWYELSDWNLDEHGRCRYCAEPLAGHFAATPGQWGSKRQVVNL
jgi:pyruvate formate lyase activating enzyme